MIFFSVVIPLYNKENFIKKTIKSVLYQTFENYEIIVINDGSTDGSLEKVKQINSEKIKIFSQKNKGLSSSRNKGIELSKGKFIALLDADDLWVENYLESIHSLIYKFPEINFFGSSYYEKRNNKLLLIKSNLDKKTINKSFIIEDFFKANHKQFIPDQSSLTFRRQIFTNTTKPYNENITYNEDVDFYLNNLVKNKIAFINSPLMIKNYDTFQEQLSSGSISTKILPDLDFYEQKHTNNESVKKYINIQRYKYIIKYINEGNKELKKEMLKKTTLHYLSFSQKIMINLPSFIIVILRKVKFIILKTGIRLTTN